MKTPKRTTSHLRGEITVGQIGALIGFLLVIFISIAGKSGSKDSGSSSSSSSSSRDLDSALQKGSEGRATDMTGAEMDAFRIEQQRISEAHKRKVISELPPEERALRDKEEE